jgi:prepilin-type N-terminal cleavage/methylation domain-containing protein
VVDSAKTKIGSARLRRTGFTLIELLVVVAILGILAVIAVNIYKKYIKKSRLSEAISQLSDIKAKQEAYNGRYDRYASVCDNVTATSCAAWFYPTSTAYDAKSTWDPAAMTGGWVGFVQLGIDKKQDLFFAYGTVSDGPNPGQISAPSVLGLPAGTSWFCAAARAKIYNNSADDVYLELTSHTDKAWQIGIGVNTASAVPSSSCGCSINAGACP